MIPLAHTYSKSSSKPVHPACANYRTHTRPPSNWTCLEYHHFASFCQWSVIIRYIKKSHLRVLAFLRVCFAWAIDQLCPGAIWQSSKQPKTLMPSALCLRLRRVPPCTKLEFRWQRNYWLKLIAKLTHVKTNLKIAVGWIGDDLGKQISTSTLKRACHTVIHIESHRL